MEGLPGPEVIPRGRGERDRGKDWDCDLRGEKSESRKRLGKTMDLLFIGSINQYLRRPCSSTNY